MILFSTVRKFLLGALAALLAVSLASPASAGPRKPQTKRARAAANDAHRRFEEKTGTFATREGLRLRLVTDLGDVRILTVDPAAGPAAVSYRVRIETDSQDAEAQKLLKQFSLSSAASPAGVQLTGQVPWHGFHGRLWVSYEVSVPRRYNLEVTTQAGNIETQDVDGRVSLVTLGGNITAGRIGGPPGGPRLASTLGNPVARLETQGGHVTVQDVNGDLRAFTAGGHINAANVQGDAVLHTGGGNIRAGTIAGVAQLETGGGNISVQRARSNVTAATEGGQIDFGEAAGSIHARSGGGAIRVLRVSGPMQLASTGGSIYLTQVRGGVHASTGAGNITAWFAPEPRGLLLMRPATLPPDVSAPASPAGIPTQPRPGTPARPPQPGAALAVGAVPAPGEPQAWKLVGPSQLEATQGDIVVYVPRELAVTIEAVVEMAGEHRIEADPALPLKVKYVDSGSGTKSVRGECTMNGGGEVVRLKTTSGNIHLKVSDSAAQEDLYRRQIADLTRRLAVQQQRLVEQLSTEQVLALKQLEQQVVQAQKLAADQKQQAAEAAREATRTWIWSWPWTEALPGAFRVAPEEQQKKLITSVNPVYPALAREAGVEGTVHIRVVVGKDGTVQDARVISGPSLLRDAATDAVKQWRYQPTIVDGKPASVVTTVAIQFRLE
jgi:TonB family protein